MATGSQLGAILLLGGGGPALLPGLDWLARSVAPRGAVLVLPQAWPEARYGECLAQMEELFSEVGLASNRIRAGFDLSACARTFSDHSAVYLCGGNTFALLAALQRPGIIAALDSYRRSGGIIAGNSAGAMVLGRSIHHAHDPNTVALTDFSGYDWVLGYSIWCHYSPDQHNDEIQALMLARDFPVLALADDCAITAGPSGVTTCEGSSAPLFFENR